MPISDIPNTQVTKKWTEYFNLCLWIVLQLDSSEVVLTTILNFPYLFTSMQFSCLSSYCLFHNLQALCNVPEILQLGLSVWRRPLLTILHWLKFELWPVVSSCLATTKLIDREGGGGFVCVVRQELFTVLEIPSQLLEFTPILQCSSAQLVQRRPIIWCYIFSHFIANPHSQKSLWKKVDFLIYLILPPLIYKKKL